MMGWMAEQALDVHGLDGVILRPLVSPLPTLLEGVRDLVTDRPPAILSHAGRRRARAQLRAADLRALSPFRELGPAPGAAGQPNEVAEPTPGATLDEELGRIAAIAPERLAERIESGDRHGRPTASWRSVQRDPDRWLADYVAALRRFWLLLAPWWRMNAGRIDREVERLETARAHRASRDLITQLGAPGRLEVVRERPGDLRARRWLLPSHTDSSGVLYAGRTLDLVPLASASAGAGWADDDADLLLSIRYPAPPCDAAAPSSLEALLGRERALLLRALERPKTAGRLAERVFLSPSGLTHHAGALEAAGLVARTRTGRHVVVRRTARAERLLGLYGAR